MLKVNGIGNKITEARKKKAMSQAQLAARLFISPQAVGKWERGESMPDIVTFSRLAEVLGVDLNYFSENFQSAASEMVPVESLSRQSTESPSGEEKKKRSWNMSRGNLVDNDFSGLKNLHEEFNHSNIQRCLFIGSDLTELLLKSNTVDGCNFSNANISSSHFQRCSLLNSLFKNCLLKEAQFSESQVKGCDFSGADFTGVTLKTSSFLKNAIVDAVWNRTSFITTGFADIVFGGVLEDCFFEDCEFKEVKFQNSTLINTYFKNSRKLKQVQFIDCKADKLTYAFLKNEKADLSGITLLTP